MSSVADILVNAQDGKLVENLAQNLGLSAEQADAAVKALAPALAMGLANAANDPGALEKIIAGAAQPETHQAAFFHADAAHSDDMLEEGRAILTQLFGSSDASGKIAQVAARETGLRPDILSQLLPVLASVVLGGLFKNLNSQGLGPIFEQIVKGGGLGEILGKLGGAAGGGATQGGAAGGGLSDILEQLARNAGAGGGQAAPQSGGGSGLGGLLGGLLGALLGGGGARAQRPGGPSPAPSPTPAGLDPATLQAALEQLKKILAPAGSASAPKSGGGGYDTDLQDVLGQVFGQKRS
jgi:hypothetical protein